MNAVKQHMGLFNRMGDVEISHRMGVDAAHNLQQRGYVHVVPDEDNGAVDELAVRFGGHLVKVKQRIIRKSAARAQIDDGVDTLVSDLIR